MRSVFIFVVVVCLSAKIVSGDGPSESSKSTKAEKITAAPRIDKNVQAASATSLISESSKLEKTFVIQMQICEGDPKSPPTKENLEILSRPVLATIENQACVIQVSSGEVPILEPQGNGNVSIRYAPLELNIEAKVWQLPNDKVQLSFKMKRTTQGERRVDHVDLHTKTTESLVVAKLGESFKIHLDDENSGSKKQTWAEIVINDRNPAKKKPENQILPAPLAPAVDK